MDSAQETVIRINVRPGWHQRTRLPLDSPALLDRMERQARLALAQFGSQPYVEVLAMSGIYARIVRLDRPEISVRTAAGRRLPAWA